MHRGKPEGVCSCRAGTAPCRAEGKPCSCHGAVSSGNAGEMDGASTAVLVLDAAQSLERKEKIQINKIYCVLLGVVRRNRDIFLVAIFVLIWRIKETFSSESCLNLGKPNLFSERFLTMINVWFQKTANMSS